MEVVGEHPGDTFEIRDYEELTEGFFRGVAEDSKYYLGILISPEIERRLKGIIDKVINPKCKTFSYTVCDSLPKDTFIACSGRKVILFRPLYDKVGNNEYYRIIY
jgi:hypothetical protein